MSSSFDLQVSAGRQRKSNYGIESIFYAPFMAIFQNKLSLAGCSSSDAEA
jgi:hypothetical protein